MTIYPHNLIIWKKFWGLNSVSEKQICKNICNIFAIIWQFYIYFWNGVVVASLAASKFGRKNKNFEMYFRKSYKTN